MTADLRDKLPEPFGLHHVIEHLDAEVDAILLTEDQKSAFYMLLVNQENPVKMDWQPARKLNGIRIETS